ncbi:MAG: RNA 2',3'-cyclic phosphodiesterase [Eubacteriales bacterium]|nr:RNA 2',3'-cyclic phosphodiesterase [Eubacteriales bacterium]MCI6028454.1 RNA 2',3'-cyclic phosphodiesterase [Clostridiales bacterium]MDD7415086.1 RNA 2',3'-cyclic phosphodiesterase [Clostridiales bacterium]MDY5732498.1 RNA 2',3'-cyclic phosphodiesterase [Eubacteriales bacterium]
MRLFVAIELPRQMKKELKLVQDELKLMSGGGRFVPDANFHITLHFIGETDRLNDAVCAVRDAARGIRPFSLHLGRYSSFERNDLRTSFVGVEGDLRELGTLYEAVQCAVYDYGFGRERKRYVPHITLGRSVTHDELVDAQLKELTPNASMRVESVTLFESVRVKGEMTYRAIHRERLE